jgi:AcrR family transcriptional regulator
MVETEPTHSSWVRVDPARHPTKQALLDATIADMEATGEASIRVSKIIRAAGATSGSIAYHFGSREALIQEAIAERYLSAVSQGLVVFTTRIGEVTTAEQLEEFFRTELVRLGDSSFHELRVRRISALGASLLRPGLRERIVAEQAAYFDRASLPIMRLQRLGVIDPNIDTRAFAAWFLGLLLSRVLSRLDERGEVDGAWAQFTLRAILVNLLGPSSVVDQPTAPRI